jgi:hypothetical protein
MAKASPARPRRTLVFALIGLASVIGFLSLFAIWANRQLLETETWSDTSGQLLENEEIRTQVADFMVDSLFANVDVSAELQQALPPRAAPLAGPLAGALRDLATRRANVALQRPAIQELWEESNRNAQQTLIDVVENGGDQSVTLDVGSIVDQLGAQLGVGTAGKLPPGVADIEIANNDDLVTAHKLLNALKASAVVLLLLTLVLFALALYLAKGWRREALRSIGFAFIGIGVVTLVVRNLAGGAVTDALASTESVKPAADAAWSIGTDLLSAQAGGTIFYGIFIVLGAWLAGPKGFALSARKAITPILEQRSVAYAALGALLLFLFWWSPTPGFERLPTALLLIVLSIVGLEFLRRKAVSDFPGEHLDEATERWSAAIRSRFSG